MIEGEVCYLQPTCALWWIDIISDFKRSSTNDRFRILVTTTLSKSNKYY